MKQNIYQISCICQYTNIEDNEGLKLQMFYVKHFNVKNKIKSIFATICNTYRIIQYKIQMICLINSQKNLLMYILTDCR